jgi:anti-anti-sigma factor
VSDIRQRSVRQTTDGERAAPFAWTAPPFAVVAEEAGRVRLSGELDLSTVGELLEALERLPHGAETIDLGELSFMDASGLHALERYAQRTPEGTGPLVLENVPRQIRRLFEITGADRNPDIELRTGRAHG